MYRNIYHLLALIGLLVSSCASKYNPKSPYEPLVWDAIRRFAELQQAGELPALARDEHGRLESEPLPQRDRVVYQVSVIIHVAKDGDPSRYGYTLMKHDSLSEWRLAKAWREHPDGQHEDLKLD